MNPGRLYLIPTPLGEGKLDEVLPREVQATVARLTHFVVEAPKSARAFLKRVGMPQPLASLSLFTLDEHTPQDALADLLAPLRAGIDVGLVSEAGCPAVADPGAQLVHLAHREGIPVVPLVGPSALLLALMASGLNGQRFRFHGYLPVAREARRKCLRELEADSRRRDETQIFIETPYRNRALLQAIVESCAPGTELCVALALTTANERILTRPIAAWRAADPLPEWPAVFLLYAAPGTSPLRRRREGERQGSPTTQSGSRFPLPPGKRRG